MKKYGVPGNTNKVKRKEYKAIYLQLNRLQGNVKEVFEVDRILHVEVFFVELE